MEIYAGICVVLFVGVFISSFRVLVSIFFMFAKRI